MSYARLTAGALGVAFGLAVIGLAEAVSPPQQYREGPLQSGLMPGIKGLLYEGK